MAAVYLVIPTDLFPEALLGPVGVMDDLVVIALGRLPVATRVVSRLPGLIAPDLVNSANRNPR